MRLVYQVDPDDPRAPTQDQWDAMPIEQRAEIVAQLPSEPRSETMPEGDRHRIPKERAAQALSEFFFRTKRRVYLSAELAVYYPGERWFAPDLIAVLDVEPDERSTWVVAQEGKGLDFVLEVTLAGDRHKDLVDNVGRYARLGISEYFILDLLRSRIIGYRLPAGAATYSSIVPQSGRWASSVLGLDLVLENGRIRFFVGNAPLLESGELVGRLSHMVDELVSKEERLARELEEAQSSLEEQRQRAEKERERADAAEARGERLAARLRALGVDPEGD